MITLIVERSFTGGVYGFCKSFQVSAIPRMNEVINIDDNDYMIVYIAHDVVNNKVYVGVK